MVSGRHIDIREDVNGPVAAGASGRQRVGQDLAGVQPYGELVVCVPADARFRSAHVSWQARELVGGEPAALFDCLTLGSPR